jgi:hypothetical protein
VSFFGLGALIAHDDKGTREPKKPFHEAQLDLCRDASEAAATLASLTPRGEASSEQSEAPWEKARARFEQLYWGSLAVVEDEDLEGRMVDFRERLVAYEKELRAGTLEEDKRLEGIPGRAQGLQPEPHETVPFSDRLCLGNVRLDGKELPLASWEQAVGEDWLGQ